MMNSSASRPARASNLIWRHLIGAVFALCVGAVPIETGHAQDVVEPVVLIVDMQRVQRDSEAAITLRAQSASVRAALEKAVAERARKISQEEEELANLRERLPADEFKMRVREFEEKVFATRDLAQQESAKLQAALASASGRLRNGIAPILAEIMRERRAQVMLDSSRVILSIDVLDITDEVIERLNKSLPSVELRISSTSE